MIRAAVIVLVALAGAAPAAAVTGHRPAGVGAAPSEQQLADMFLQTARSYWPGAPCEGREVVQVDAGAAISERVGGDKAGMAIPEECRVLIGGGMPPTEFCITLAHELGHLAGRGHEPYGLMSERSMEIGPCVPAAAAQEFAYQWRQAVADLPDDGRRWRVTRSRARREDGAQVYVAAREGMLRRSIRVIPASRADPYPYVVGPSIVLRRSGVGVLAPRARALADVQP
jgi:hypothetical protein